MYYNKNTSSIPRAFNCKIDQLNSDLCISGIVLFGNFLKSLSVHNLKHFPLHILPALPALCFAELREIG